MKIISPPEIWEPSDGIVLEEAADSAVRCSNNHVLVIAGPGAGKTELLAQKAAFLFQTNLCIYPQKILAISFKTDAAQNLKERVEQRCGSEIGQRFSSMTYDAFAKSILDHFVYALPERLRPSIDYLVEDAAVIDAAFKNIGYKNPENLKPSKLKERYNLLLESTDISIEGNEPGQKAWQVLLHGFDGYKATLSFKMIMKLAIYIIKTNPFIKRALQMTYSYVFLDEFQDTTAIQYDFVRECFWGSNTMITAVGDNKQRIMVWAGAVKTIFNDFYAEMKPQGLRLTMNHRSAPRLVALQKSMYESLREKPLDVVVSDKWEEQDGDITLVIADNEQYEAASIVDSIMTQIAGGTRPNDICILCKQRPQDYSSTIIKNLEENGIRARIENEYQDLIKEPIVDLLLNYMVCVSGTRHPKEWNYVEETVSDLWGIYEQQQNSFGWDEMHKELAALADSINETIKQGLDAAKWHGILNEILRLWGIERVKAKYPAYGQGGYFNSIIEKFERLFFEEYIVSHGDWQRAIECFCGEHSIPIMTIHKSKGLEYSTVYFVGLEDSAFWSFKTQPEEDRCAFFVALSRAKKTVVFTFCRQRNNLKYPSQKHTDINEFFDLLQKPGVAKVICATGE